MKVSRGWSFNGGWINGSQLSNIRNSALLSRKSLHCRLIGEIHLAVIFIYKRLNADTETLW